MKLFLLLIMIPLSISTPLNAQNVQEKTIYVRKAPSDAKTMQTRESFDQEGRVIEQVHYLISWEGKSPVIERFRYNEQGDLILWDKVVEGETVSSIKYRLEYDSTGRLQNKSWDDGEGERLEKIFYGEESETHWMMEGGREVSREVYDLEGRLKESCMTEIGICTRYFYDDKGTLLRKRDIGGEGEHVASYINTYDEDGNCVEVLHPSGVRVKTRYNAKGLPSTRTMLENSGKIMRIIDFEYRYWDDK